MKIMVIIGAVLLVAALLGLQYYLDEWALKANNCGVCGADYLDDIRNHPQCFTVACEPVTNALH